jgi:ankyrin repeat protein
MSRIKLTKMTKNSLTLKVGVLAVAAAVTWSTGLFAQETLIDLAKAGKTEIVVAAITSPDLNLNQQSADGSTSLLWATYNVDYKMVTALLEKGADPNIANNFGAFPLSEATKLGDLTLVSLLLKAGADPNLSNTDNQTALMLAANVGSVEIANLLVEAGADVNAIEGFRQQDALMWAAANNQPKIVKLLVEAGADVNRRSKADDWPRQMTSEPRAQFRDTGGLTSLLYATRSGCLECVKTIVEAGADIDKPNPDGVTPLINALDNKKWDIAWYLLDKGARNDIWDMSGRTPLYVAVDQNSFRARGFFAGFFNYGRGKESAPNRFTGMDLINRLLSEGVDTDHQLTRMRPNGYGRGRFADYMMRGGTGPLMVATLSYDIDAMKALLAAGAEVDLPNVYQITPLMAAVGMSGNSRGPATIPEGDIQAKVIEAIDLLLDAGADINKTVTDSRTYTAKMDAYIIGRDQEGRTALFAAAETGWDRVVTRLLERGADPTMLDAEGKGILDAAMNPVRTGPGASMEIAGANREVTISLVKEALDQ